MKGHINGKPVSRMLVDTGAIVNLMPYSVFKKLGGSDGELVKTNMTVSGLGGEPLGAKGVASMELTVGSKTVATAFFVADVKGNFNIILGRDWIHANRCVPSTLHQCLIQWVDEAVETVYGDTSASIAVADVQHDMAHEDFKCLTGTDISDCRFISCDKDGFVSVGIAPISEADSAALVEPGQTGQQPGQSGFGGAATADYSNRPSFSIFDE